MKNSYIIILFLFTNILIAKDKYLIITTQSYKESSVLDNFIQHRSNDFDVEVAINSEVGDMPEHFKNYIIDENPYYVLLVGNYSDFPSKTIPYYKPVESYNFWISEQIDSLFELQIPLGLFFVDNENELENIISKTIKFEQNLEEMPAKLYTHSGGSPYEPVKPWPLEFNDEILNEMYDSFFKTNGYLHRHETSLDDTANDAQNDVQAINNGIKYMFYHGHGNIPKWSYGMGIAGIPYLKNTEYFPVIFSASCLTGTFTGKIDTMEAPCLAANMLASENGAVAFIGAYNISSKGQNPILYGFSKNVNDKSNERLGDALLKAFNNTEMPETVKKYHPHIMAYEYNRARLQFHLFGDPALKINSAGTNVKINREENIFSVSPNPASDYIEISLGSHSVNKGLQPLVHGYEIEVYDVLGERVYSTEGTERSRSAEVDLYGHFGYAQCPLRIDISHLPRGLYFVRFGDRVEKFIKM